jgi:alpha-tubulin suppressor-like RCC1 family protein
MSTQKGVWKLQEVRDQILAGQWEYTFDNIPDTFGFGTATGAETNTSTESGEVTVTGLDPNTPINVSTNVGTIDAGTTVLSGTFETSKIVTTSASGTLVVKVRVTSSASFATSVVATITIGAETGSFTVSTRAALNQLWVWGNNTCGRLGDGTTIGRNSPVQVPGNQWLSLSAGLQHSLALKTNNTLWAWGQNFFGSATGALGDNTGVDGRSSPIQIPGTQWNRVAGARLFSLATKSDGTLWSWGRNGDGQLGHGNTIHRSSPIQVPGTQWCEVSGGTHSMAIKNDGTLWSWGSNGTGELGHGNTIQRSSPIQIPGNQWIDANAGNCFSFARKTDGTLWGWGRNDSSWSGALGDGTTINRNSPIQVPGNQWNDVALGNIFTLARKSDGTLWAWGENGQGRLGDGTTIPRSSPIQVPGNQWVCMSGQYQSAIATKTDGTLWSWGNNAQGQFGDGTSIQRSSPIQIPGTQWSVTCGDCHVLAFKAT